MTQTVTAPVVARYQILGRDGASETIDAKLLGWGSSNRPDKTRWFEVAIYRTVEGEYVVHTMGKSIVRDEQTRARIIRTSSPYEIVEVLTVTHRGDTYVPNASTRALAQAAAHDTGVREAYLRLLG